MADTRASPPPTSSHVTFIWTTPIANSRARNARDPMRLGYAVQLGTVRFLGTFLEDPSDVPPGVTGDLARQLGITDPRCLTRYREGRAKWQHAREIRAGFGYREFTDGVARYRLTRWLYALCWTGTDRPSVLFDRATAWLVTEKVLLPGASALERLVARIRARAAQRLWRSLAARHHACAARTARRTAAVRKTAGRARSIGCATGRTCAAAPSWRALSNVSTRCACWPQACPGRPTSRPAA